MAWSEDRVARLKVLHADGLSASQIAAALGDLDDCQDGGRSAVIGKIHRLGISSGRKPRGPNKVPRAPRARRIAPPKYTRPEPDDDEEANDAPDGKYGEPTAFDLAIPAEQRRTFRDLDGTTCKWPCGDPQDPAFFFCGARPIAGLPYCSTHSRRAYDSAATRRKEKRSSP